MSQTAAYSALQRMHLREALFAPHYQGIAADLQRLSAASPEEEERRFMEARRVELCSAFGLPAAEQRKPFAFSNGVAVIPITGTLINRFGQSYGLVTGYQFVRRQTALADADPDVKAIVYDVSSYGGEAAGCFETARIMRQASKPTLAVVDAQAYSAGYALASGAKRIAVTPSGGVGSIGVVAMHMDISKALSEMGIKITFIHSGEHKVDGNPFEPLPDDVKANLQKGVDASRADFVALVAEHRGLDAKVVYDTEARTYRAEDALALGLIDVIATPSEAVQAFITELSGSSTTLKETVMSESTTPGATTPDTTAAQAEARKAERARVQAIMGCEEAKNRQSLASHLALHTEMSAEDAKAVLAASAEEKPAPAAKSNAFEQAMNGTPNPNIGADGGEGGNDDPAAQAVAKILANHAAATGVKYETAAR